MAVNIKSRRNVGMSDSLRIAYMPRAGKINPIGDRVAACLQELKRAPTPPAVQKYQNSNQPGPGMIRLHHGKAEDPKVSNTLIHGLCNRPSLPLTAAMLINPTPQSELQQTLQELEESVYASRHKAPLGRKPVSDGLPLPYDERTTFGKKTNLGMDAGEIINPAKTTKDLEKEEQQGHELYVRTHNGFFIGEQVDRKYNFNKNSRFGVTTPYLTNGSIVNRCLHWIGESRPVNPRGDWKRAPDSKEKLQQLIGNAYSSKKRGNNVELSPDHAFGYAPPQDDFGVAELIHVGKQPAGKRPRAEESHYCLANAVRNRLKVLNFQNFSSLLEAFRHYDKKSQGRIDTEDLREVCRHFKVEITDVVLDEVFEECDKDRDGFIDFLEFSNFLNFKEKLPLGRREQHLVRDAQFQTGSQADPNSRTSGLPNPGALLKSDDLEPFRIGHSQRAVKTVARHDSAMDRFVTTSSFIGAASREPRPYKTRTFGIPTVRSDIAAPRVRKIDDNINYGDMTMALDLLLPSVYTRQGIHQEDLFCPRTKKELTEIFRNLGASIPEKIFDEAWKLASTRHPNGDVSVDAFRTVLKQIKAL
ncbi:EF-hand domain-containing family member B [Stigmatopora argus]